MEVARSLPTAPMRKMKRLAKVMNEDFILNEDLGIKRRREISKNI